MLRALALLLPALLTQDAGEETVHREQGNSFGYSLAALGDRNGSTLWVRSGPQHFGQSLAAVADVDGDGRLDFAAGCTGDEVLLCSGSDGATLGGIPLPEDLPSGYTRCEVLTLPGPGGEPTADFAILWRTRWSLPGDARARVHARLERFAASSRESLGQVPLHGKEPGEAISSLPDLDGDGRADLACTVPEGEGGWNCLNIASGRSGDVLFAFAPNLWNAEEACSVVGPGDFDGDGTADLAVGTCESQTGGDDVPDLLATTYAGLGANGAISAFSGVDGARVRHAELTGTEPPGFRALFIGDVNGDGASDYAVSYLCVFWQPQDAEGVRVFSGADGQVLYTVLAH